MKETTQTRNMEYRNINSMQPLGQHLAGTRYAGAMAISRLSMELLQRHIMRKIYKFGIVFLLAFMALVPVAVGQYATGGSSVYKDQVLWITWGGGTNGTHNQPLANGTTSTASITIADGQVLSIQFTIENATGTALRSYAPGNWEGDMLDDLYNGNNQLVNGISTNGISNFRIRASATLNGAPFPLKGFVMADA